MEKKLSKKKKVTLAGAAALGLGLYLGTPSIAPYVEQVLEPLLCPFFDSCPQDKESE